MNLLKFCNYNLSDLRSNYHTPKDNLYLKYVNERLITCFNSYSKDLDLSLLYLSNKNGFNVTKKLNRIMKE